ncbi:MAG: hypothetical protein H7A25_12530 [Leptospiraceae bacterium]|nr:hypothetical protein [Leptospiraceae bacterium]MCP5500725.1 hypothetical protein [Leptospiraceae bacterium]
MIKKAILLIFLMNLLWAGFYSCKSSEVKEMDGKIEDKEADTETKKKEGK